jgi:hypothetical protein
MARFHLAYSDLVIRFSLVLQKQYLILDQPKYHLSKIREAVSQSWGYGSFTELQTMLVPVNEASEWHHLQQNGFERQYLNYAEHKMGPSPFHIRAYRNTTDHFVQSSCLLCSIVEEPPKANS